MASGNHSPSLPGAARRWWHEHAQRIGWRRAAGEVATEIWDFLRDSTPDRRRQRYGDMDYDWEHRVDTTSATVGWRDRLLGIFHSPYQPTEPSLFREMIEGLGIHYARYTFIDLGSGKGRTLLMASEYPFRRVLGIELLPELHRIAEENIRKFEGERRRCSAIESVCGDACEFAFPPEPLVLYLFNPLPEEGLKQVMRSLQDSLAQRPREAWVVYHNPLLEHVVAGCRELRKTAGTTQYAVYASEVAKGALAVSN
jgi:SAM-dependent methyltransferase